MPESRYPTLADGTLVQNTNAAMGFPAIPGKPTPEGIQYPLVDYDLGSHFRYADQSGVLTKRSRRERHAAAARRARRCGRQRSGRDQIAAAVGAARHLHGLERHDIRSLSRASSAARASAHRRSADSSRLRRRRRSASASGDPRLSLEERYKDHDGYVQAVKTAADKLVRDGYLLAEDAATMIGAG